MVLAWVAGCTASASDSTKSFHTAEAKPPAVGTMFIYPERIPLRDGGFVNAERGFVFVPINRSRKGSDVIGIEVYRFRASANAQPGTPPIFFLHGGPGFPGLQGFLEREGTFEERWRPLTDVSDVVVVSQRGIGSSKPTTTIDVPGDPIPAGQPFEAEKVRGETQQIYQREKAFWEEAGVDLKGFTALEAAEDLNDVRKALGYDQITIWGGSFGSHWGMTLMRARPEIVARAVLWGMEGVDQSYDHPGWLWNVYKRVAEEAERAPELKGMIPEGGLIAAVEAMVERARTKPFTVTVTDTADNTKHEILFDGELIKPLSRGYGPLSNWPASVITMARGDYREAAQARLRWSRAPRRTYRTASYYMLDCGSGVTAKRLADQTADPANQLLWRMNSIYLDGCSVWESDLGDDFRKNFETTIPTVIVHGTWDLSTPLENAHELAPYFKNSKFIPVVRGPHGAVVAAMDASEEFRKGILHFAASGDMSQLPDTVTLPPVTWRVPSSR
jgi:pimeloyl-ACP methyl ester carboxylesterase